MWGTKIALLVCLCILFGIVSAQTPAKVDFAKDVLPILRQNCVGCHGPAQQTSGLRLDRKSAVISRRGVVPGSSENSFLYHRISGNAYGMQMPPTGALRPEQINIIKTWIDQGADWPDSLANEAELPPLNPKAVAMVEALRTGDLPGFMKSVAEDPKLLNARGPEGSTPFMYAVLYTGAPTLERLLKQGADPNKRNDANATALMWAAIRPGENPPPAGPRRGRQCAFERHANAADDRGAPSRQYAPQSSSFWSAARIPIPTRIRPPNRRR